MGIPHCPNCGKVISRQTVDQMVDEIMKLPERTKFMVLAPVVRGRKGEHVKLLEKAKKSGFVRVVVDGSMYELSEEIKLDKNKKHSIDSSRSSGCKTGCGEATHRFHRDRTSACRGAYEN